MNKDKSKGLNKENEEIDVTFTNKHRDFLGKTGKVRPISYRGESSR